jgi:hypothetical protein
MYSTRYARSVTKNTFEPGRTLIAVPSKSRVNALNTFLGKTWQSRFPTFVDIQSSRINAHSMLIFKTDRCGEEGQKAVHSLPPPSKKSGISTMCSSDLGRFALGATPR